MKCKKTTLILLSAIAFASFVQAQDEESAGLTPSPGIQMVTRVNSERVALLLEVAEVYYADGEYDSAIAALERALEIDPENMQTRYIISRDYLIARKYAEAEKILLALVDEYPEDYQVKNNLAWLYATAEDPAFRKGKEAVKLAQEALVEAPFVHNVWSTLSEAYYVTQNYERALRAAVQTLDLARSNLKELPPESEAQYTLQIEKCSRAWEAQKVLDSLKDDEVQPKE
ncbi:MAG: tetratricopeptide repeat protein [Pontiellaceae bacterium]|nr:tetratricopeptide repeat protein [Pontiellaceae bacterium]